jgi:hypothetical protein
LNQLGEDPSGATGVQEGHLMTPGSGPRDLVDEFEALLLELGEGFREIGDAIRDVVQSLAPFLQEASDSGIRIKWLQQLHGSDEADPDALAREFLHRGTFFASHAFEKRTRLLQGGYGHGDVVQR